jgi:peptidoglycan/LPS O-acetylase OafA/YrhL
MRVRSGHSVVADQKIELHPHDHIGFIDGIRGLLSLGVFAFHAAGFAGFNSLFVPSGPIAVDIFMMLSGFVMVFTMSRTMRGVESPAEIGRFYLRRIFRIAPVYYLLLFVALLFSASLYKFSSEAVAQFPPAWAANLGNDPSDRSVTVANVLMHLTFLFGLDPRFASNNALPDWSLSLEMQFYAVVPFLMIMFRRFGLFLPILALAALNFLTTKYVGLYLAPKSGVVWPQPSLLFFRIDCFLVGMLLAIYFFEDAFNKIEVLSILLVLAFFDQHRIFSFAAAGCFAMLGAGGKGEGGPFRRLALIAANVLRSKLAGFFGDLSYDVYLLHPLVLLPCVHLLMQDGWYLQLSAAERFAVLLIASAAVVIPLSYVIHKTIEGPGKRLARSVGDFLFSQRDSESALAATRHGPAI